MPDLSKKLSFLQSARARLFLAIGLVVVAIGVIAYVVHVHNQNALNVGSASVSGTPSLTSIPGAGNPSSAYVKAQNIVNQEGAEAAAKKGTSFVPTITRAGFVGNPDQFGDATTGAANNCNLNKVVVMYKPNPESCTLNRLESARQAGVTAEELTCQGCACPALKSAGYNAGELKQIGMTAEQLKACGFDLAELVKAGFSAADLKNAGYSAAALKAAGFSAGELKAAGYSAAALKAAGFSAAELKAAGYSAAELKAAGYSAAALKAAGFSPKELEAAGYSPAELKAAGFTAQEASDADATSAKCSVQELTKERAEGISAEKLRDDGCGLAALKAAGYSARDLRAAGFSAAQLKAAGFSAKQLKDAGFSAAQLKAAGYSAGQLLAAGYSPKELKDAGFTAAELHAAGLTAAELKDAGFSRKELEAAGYTPGDLTRAGFKPEQATPGTTTMATTPGAVTGATPGTTTAAPGVGMEAAANAQPSANNLPSSTQTPQATLPTIGQNSGESRLEQLEKQQQAQMTIEQQRNQAQRLMAYMSSQAEKFMVGWSNVSNQTYVTAPLPKKGPGSTAGGASGFNNNAGGANGAQSSDMAGGEILKAGTVLFGVFETSVNSDDNSPVMGKIVSGPLQGSKLLGTFTRQDDRVLIQFSLMNDPYYPKSIPINAVAIDPDTARTALSGSVDHHYMLRYGTLFASSFLQGMAEGVINSGTTSTCTFGTTGCQITQSSLSPVQQVEMGFGKVGQQYAQHMSNDFNTPPTVRVGAGTGFGLLLMGDLQLPVGAIPSSQANQH